MARARVDHEALFWTLIEPDQNSGCWLWAGSVNPDGYGTLGTHLAHRFSFALEHGPIPKRNRPSDSCVCHKCDTRACVNPAHLFLGTALDNSRDRQAKGRGRGELRRKPQPLPPSYVFEDFVNLDL